MSSSVARIVGNIVLVVLSILGGFLAFSHLGISTKSTEGIVILSLLLYIIAERALTVVDILSNEKSLSEFLLRKLLYLETPFLIHI
jgi:hypothetical protein